jgi:hypothetical protein
MKKRIVHSFMIFIISILVACAGNTIEESSPGDYSHLLNVNAISIEYYLISLENESDLAGLWETKAAVEHTRSQLQFNSDGSFLEKVQHKLTKEEIVSYAGKYQVVGDELTMTMHDGKTFYYLYSIKDNILRLDQTDPSRESIVR